MWLREASIYVWCDFNTLLEKYLKIIVENNMFLKNCEGMYESWTKSTWLEITVVVQILGRNCILYNFPPMKYFTEGSGGKVVLIGQDGVQRQPLSFPTAGSLLSFLNCLENGLHPHGQLDPPLFAPRSKGLGLPRLKRKERIGSESSAPVSPTKEVETQDYVFRLVSGTRSEDVGKQLDLLYVFVAGDKNTLGYPQWRNNLFKHLL